MQTFLDCLACLILIAFFWQLCAAVGGEPKRGHSRTYEGQFSAMRPSVLRRDGYRCTICGARALTGRPLHVHHIHERAKGGSNALSNLVTLCSDCHQRIHGRRF